MNDSVPASVSSHRLKDTNPIICLFTPSIVHLLTGAVWICVQACAHILVYACVHVWAIGVSLCACEADVKACAFSLPSLLCWAPAWSEQENEKGSEGRGKSSHSWSGLCGEGCTLFPLKLWKHVWDPQKLEHGGLIHVTQRIGSGRWVLCSLWGRWEHCSRSAAIIPLNCWLLWAGRAHEGPVVCPWMTTFYIKGSAKTFWFVFLSFETSIQQVCNFSLVETVDLDIWEINKRIKQGAEFG